MFKSFRDMSIGTKIIIIVLFICIISQLLIGLVSYSTIQNLGTYAKQISSDLGTHIGNNSEAELKNQVEDYLKKISKTMSDVSDKTFAEISNQIDSTALGIEHIYSESSKNAHYGEVPNLPGWGNNSTDVNNATGKGYVVDRDSSDDNNLFLYNYSKYTGSDRIYKTNKTNLSSLNEEERENLKKEYIIVSDVNIPNNLESEIRAIDGFKYFMKSMYDVNKTISSIYLGTESGIVYDYSPYSIMNRYDPVSRPWYKDAVDAYKNGDTKGVWQSKYYSFNNGEPCITISKAYTDADGNIKGVIAIDMYLKEVEQYVLESKVGSTGYSFLIDKSGQVVMSSDYNSNNAFSDYILNSDMDESYRNVLNDMRSGKEGISKAIVTGKEYYIAYYPMKTTGWSMGVMTEISEVMSPVSMIHDFIEDKIVESKDVINGEISEVRFKFIIILSVCSGVVILIGTWISNEIVKPLRRLNNGARKIGKGDLTLRFSVKSKDEVGELASTFNKMTSSLQEYIENLAITTKEKEKIHSELSVAKKIQLSMLPCIFPAFPDRKDFDIYAVMEPAKEVGGDFYDFFFIDKDNIALVIADVSGKGVSAALFMVIAKILIKNEAQSGKLPGKVFEIVNNQLCENNDAGMFVTAFMGILNIKTGEFIYSNAGHNPPIVYRASEDKFEWIKNEHSFVLAGIKGVKYKEGRMKLSPNDVLYMYTDGVTEAMNNDNELYTEKRLEEVLNLPEVKKMCIKDVIGYLRKSIDDFADGAQRSDDITIMGVKTIPLEENN